MNWHFPLGKGLLRLLWNLVSLYKAAKNLAIAVSRFKFHYIPTADYQECSCWSNQGNLFHLLSREFYLQGLHCQHSTFEGLVNSVKQLIQWLKGIFVRSSQIQLVFRGNKVICKIKVVWLTASHGKRTYFTIDVSLSNAIQLLSHSEACIYFFK